MLRLEREGAVVADAFELGEHIAADEDPGWAQWWRSARPTIADGASSVRETDTVLAVRAAPVLDDLAVLDAQDGGAVDLHRLARRLDAVERVPVCVPRTVQFDTTRSSCSMRRSTVKAMSGNARADLRPPLELLAADVGADRVRVDPFGDVAHEVGGPELEHSLLVACDIASL